MGFGMRYGLTMAVCGVSPTILAALTMRLIRKSKMLPQKAQTYLPTCNCFIADCDIGCAVIVAVTAMSSVYATVEDIDGWIAIAVDWIFAMALLLYIQVLAFCIV